MLLIARAPVRISFGGGGTDIPAYYERYGGMVVSTAINYYVYTILTPGQPDGVQIFSADYRSFTRRPICEDLIWNGDLSLPKAIVYYFNIRDGLTIFLASQVPPGTGLGSSGSVAVSMIKALAFWCGLDLGPREVAELACFIEINKLGMPVGKQDQYAAAFGGLNCFTFLRDEVRVEPLRMPPQARQELEQGLMLFFTGISRQSSTILKRQQEASRKGDRETIRRLTAIKELGQEIRRALENGDLWTFGELLHRSWLEKRQVAEGITNPELDRSDSSGGDGGSHRRPAQRGLRGKHCLHPGQRGKRGDGLPLRLRPGQRDHHSGRPPLPGDRADGQRPPHHRMEQRRGLRGHLRRATEQPDEPGGCGRRVQRQRQLSQRPAGSNFGPPARRDHHRLLRI